MSKKITSAIIILILVSTCQPAVFVKFGGGFDFVIHESVIINFEASYHYAQLNFKEKLVNQTFGLGKTDLNAGYIGGGVKYRF